MLVADGQMIEPGDALHEGSRTPADMLRLKGSTATEVYLVAEVQKVYKSQGVEIHDKHIELIIRQMMKKVSVEANGDAELLPGQLVDKLVFERENARVRKAKGEEATHEPLILGITKASLATESFLSAASFQETTKVLTDASIEGKIDRLLGPEGERDHRQADPGGDRPEALPRHRHHARGRRLRRRRLRAGGAARGAAGDRRRRSTASPAST